ncbi:MAG: diguanylate cyclase [Deltaproteobacteria bacterium]|nr:diguanylate cyclase [Deltaproteobacteria bacterium]
MSNDRRQGGGGPGEGAPEPPKPVVPLHPANQTLRLSTDDVSRLRQQHQRRGSLVVIAGTPADVGMHLVVEGEVVIGRDAPGILLRDVGTSRRHAEVRRDGDLYTVRDLGSTNGTRLNDVPLQGVQTLRDGDQILLGQTVIRFNLVDETEATFFSELNRQVGTDHLTGLVSKPRFDAAMAEALRAARAAGGQLAALMMDMDNLKGINDRHGHHVGAGTIRQVGELLSRVLAGRGEACRFGGDEFSAYLPGAGLAQALAVGEEIRAEVAASRFVVDGTTVSATLSIGVAELTPQLTAAEELLRQADAALYRAKAAGRNRVSG